MSCRHAVASRITKQHNAEIRRRRKRTRPPRSSDSTAMCALILDICDLARSKALQKTPRLCRIEPWIRRFDAKEKAITSSELESRHVEDGMVGRGQPVQREHAEHCRDRCDKNCRLERDRD